MRAINISIATALCLFFSLLCSCGNQSSYSETIKKNPPPLLAPKVADLSQSTAIVLLSVVKNKIEQPCTGFVLENGQILTAGHCFVGVLAADFSTNVFLRWVDLDPQILTLKARDEHILVGLVNLSQELDLALLKVGAQEPIPTRRAILSSEKIDVNLRTLIPGPPRFPSTESHDDLELPLSYFHANESELQYDNNVTGGFSGAPVLAVEPGLVLNLGEFFKPARMNVVGLHLGLKNSMGYGVRADRVLEFVKGSGQKL